MRRKHFHLLILTFNTQVLNYFGMLKFKLTNGKGRQQAFLFSNVQTLGIASEFHFIFHGCRLVGIFR